MDLKEEVSRIIDEKNTKRLSEDLYGLSHELIGKPCLFQDGSVTYEAIPYGSYKLKEGNEIHVQGLEKRGQLISILYYAENEPVEGVDVKVKAMSAVKPSSLFPLDPSSIKAQKIYHTILSWLANNRAGTVGTQKKE